MQVMPAPDFYDRIAKSLRPLSAFLQKKPVRRAAWGLAVMVFLGGLFLSVRARPELLSRIDFRLMMLLVFVFSPLIIAINATILQLTAAIAGARFDRPEAFRLSVLSSLLNHLPVPGGVMLRIAAMRARGANLSTATAVNIGSAALWFGFALLYTSFWARNAALDVALACFALGAAALVAGVSLICRIHMQARDFVTLLFLNASMPVIYSIAIWVGFRALGAEAAFFEAGVVSCASVIGAAASFLPAGFGAREAAGAFLASQIEVDPYTAFAVTGVVHIAMMATLSMLAMYFALQGPARRFGEQPIDNRP